MAAADGRAAAATWDEASLVAILKENFNVPGFRPGQLDAVMATLNGQDSLVVLPTGGGKSIAFQLPCFSREHGFTVVVCPLIALAKDQVDKCDERGIYAERWNCEVPETRKLSIAKDIASDQPSLRLLYTTPESLRLPQLQDSLKEACANGTLVSFAIDEAHTVSEWGHDFRPAYLELSLIKQEFPSVPMVALTASCTPRVRDDIISVLQLRSPRLVQGSFNRHNIAYEVKHKELIGDGSDDAALEDLVRFIQERPDQGGIIYARLRATCDWLASALSARDVEVGCYHAGKATDKRGRVQRDWSSGSINVVVATVAFGMGIDRADVRWVVHWNAPASMEGFYQESGRAGRDGLPSLSVLYASRADLEANRKMERGTRAGAVAEVAGYAHGAGCRRRHVLKFFGEERGPCDRSCDALCDACTDPRAVQRALSKLEQREGEVGNRAAQIRAKMMGIKVAPAADDGSGSDDGGDSGGGKASKRAAAGAMWSRATTYGSTGADGDGAASDEGEQPAPGEGATVASRNSGSAGPSGRSASGPRPALPMHGGRLALSAAAPGMCGGGAAGGTQPVVRRPPVIKRASLGATVASAAAAVAAPHFAAAVAMDVAAGGCVMRQDQVVVGVSSDGAVGDDVMGGDGTDRDAAGQHQSHQQPQQAVGATMRLPPLKRPKVLLAFKAPTRIAPPPQQQENALAQEGPGPARTSPRNTSSVSGVQIAGPHDDPASKGGAADAMAEDDGDAAEGAAVVVELPLVVRKRLPFRPPGRIGPA